MTHDHNTLSNWKVNYVIDVTEMSSSMWIKLHRRSFSCSSNEKVFNIAEYNASIAHNNQKSLIIPTVLNNLFIHVVCKLNF